MIGALVYELRALNSNSLPQHHGQLLHGLCFKLMEKFSSSLATAVHDKMSIKPFTSAEFEFLRGNNIKNKRYYIHENDIIYWRVTALNDDVLQAFLSIKPGQVLSIGNLQLMVEKLLANPELRADTGIFAPEDMIAECFSLLPQSSITMNFCSPTTFRSGTMDFSWPLPEYVFGSLADKWEAMNMPGNINANRIKEAAAAILPGDWQGASKCIVLSPRRKALCFSGRFTYRLDNLSIVSQQTMLLLAAYAEISGVGRWTAHGLGQVRIVN